MLHNIDSKVVENVERAIAAIKNGESIILVDDESRENEGDIVFAADFVSAEKINFMAKEARGLICLALDEEIVGRLNLPLMDSGNRNAAESPMGTAFTVSIEAANGVTTGISAADRAHTVKVAVDPASKPRDIVVPGHIFPLRARRGGVLERAGHTEGAVDLCQMAGLAGAGVVCEIMCDDGTMARRPELEEFANKFGMCFLTIEDLITYRLMSESFVEKVKSTVVSSSYGEVTAHLYKSGMNDQYHIAFTKGNLDPEKITDVRVQKQSPFEDVFSVGDKSQRSKIDRALEMVCNLDQAVFLYLCDNHSKDSLMESIDRMAVDYKPSDIQNKPAKSMDVRTVGTGSQILKELGVNKMRLYLSRKASIKGLGGYGLEIVEVKTM